MRPLGGIALFIAAGTLAGIPVRANAQIRTAEPGDVLVNGQDIEPYTNEWRMTNRAADGTERDVGRWLDSLDIVTIEGVEYLRRVQTTLDPAGHATNRQVHMVDRSTMAPLRSHVAAGVRIKHLDFGTGFVSGFLTLDPEARAMVLDSEQQSGAFDFEIAGILLVALHLSPGDTVQFPSYRLEPTGVTENGRPTGLRVATESITATAYPAESVQAGALGRLEAVRVVVAQGNRTLSFWLSDAAPYILRLEAETPRGTMIWEMP